MKFEKMKYDGRIKRLKTANWVTPNGKIIRVHHNMYDHEIDKYLMAWLMTAIELSSKTFARDVREASGQPVYTDWELEEAKI